MNINSGLFVVDCFLFGMVFVFELLYSCYYEVNVRIILKHLTFGNKEIVLLNDFDSN